MLWNLLMCLELFWFTIYHSLRILLAQLLGLWILQQGFLSVLYIIKSEGCRGVFFTVKAIIHASHVKMLNQELDVACVQYWSIRKFREPVTVFVCLFWPCSAACRILGRIFSSLMPLAVEAWRLNHWTFQGSPKPEMIWIYTSATKSRRIPTRV